MNDLFERPQARTSWPPASSRPHPLIELGELVLLSTFSPPQFQQIRRIQFHPGLNIVWADPHVIEGRNRRDRTSGHSAGKTTLCRILRWLLGEAHFGSENVETGIATKFEKGCAILALKVDGEPWVVGRDFHSRLDHQAVTGKSLQEILTGGWPENSEAGPFLQKLQKMAFRDFSKKRFPGRAEDISWIQLLAWLARDQEAALQAVETWRSTASGPQERTPTKFERHVLMRLVADLLTSEEWDQMNAESQLEYERSAIQEQLPGIKAVAEEACVPLSYLLGKEGDTLAGELVISSAENALKEDQLRLERMDQEFLAHPSTLARQNHDQAIRALAHANGELARRNKRSAKLEKKLGDLAGALLDAQAVLQMLKPPPGYCGKLKGEVEGRCQFYEDGVENIGAAAMCAELQKQQREIMEEFNAEQAELEEIQKSLSLLSDNEERTRIASEEGTSDRENLLMDAERIRNRIASYEAMLRPAKDRWTGYERKKTKADGLGADIRDARQKQSDIRRGRFGDRLDFAEHFRGVLSELLGPDIGGSISYDKHGQLILQADGRSPLSSAAIEALKTIAFDLTSVFRSVTGSGHHPRFLIHDSPKVADMSPVPYADLFELVGNVEQQANGHPNFQYLITTTEPPPPRFMDSGHIVLKLDASTKEGRLFMEDL